MQRGDAVVWRSTHPEGVGYVPPAIVAHVDERCMALFQAGDSVCYRRRGERGGPNGRSLVPGTWTGAHEPTTFRPPGVVRLWPQGRSWTVHRAWVDGRYVGWYVNLERPWRRSAHGVDSDDLTLDVVVTPDLSSWSWKDEDELAWAVEHGAMSAADAELARDAGEEAIALVSSSAWPFVDDDPVWSACAPDPSWPMPTVPPEALRL